MGCKSGPLRGASQWKRAHSASGSVLGDTRFAPNGTIFKDVVVLDGAIFDSSWVNLNRISTPQLLLSGDTQVTWDINIIYPGPGVYPGSNTYGKHYRMSLVSTGTSDLKCKSHASSTYHCYMYDIYCPFRQNNLPVIDWTKYASDTIWPTVIFITPACCGWPTKTATPSAGLR